MKQTTSCHTITTNITNTRRCPSTMLANNMSPSYLDEWDSALWTRIELVASSFQAGQNSVISDWCKRRPSVGRLVAELSLVILIGKALSSDFCNMWRNTGFCRRWAHSFANTAAACSCSLANSTVIVVAIKLSFHPPSQSTRESHQ